jgi:hypothetical protein
MRLKALSLNFLIMMIFMSFSGSLYADHNLREIERKCEVEWSGRSGEVSCSSSVEDRRQIERRCEVEWNGSEGEFSCSGSHYRDIERRCTAERDGTISC